MIKGITAIQKIERRSDFETLVELFSALGFEPGTGWKTAKSEGSPFLAPIGNLELVNGDAPPHTNLWVEVTDLDSVREFFRHKKIKPSVEVYDTDWGSRAFVTERLLQGALNALRRSGCKEQDITVVRVPGSFEIPSEARTLAETGSYDAIITLGCLIRGETTHYEHIATEVTRGIGQSAQQTGVPHTYGVLTCENLEQAIDRAGLKAGNKGHEAAISAIEMVSLKRKTRGMASKSRAT
jgi:6,7-dimethyl-8-ribityllumazine synthase